jgi:hypothetical protein
MNPAIAAQIPKLAGSALSLGTGLIQNIQAGKLKKKADAAMPELVDPRQAAFLSELNQKRKAIDTGADFATGMNAINTTNAATNNAIVRSTGGDVGGTIQGLLQSQQVANAGSNNVLAQGQAQQMQYNSMFNDLNNKIAARQLQLEMYNSQQLRGEWAQKKQMANQNMMAGASSLISGMGGKSQKSGIGSSMDSGPEKLTPNLTPPALSSPSNTDGLELMGNGGKIVDPSFLFGK